MLVQIIVEEIKTNAKVGFILVDEEMLADKLANVRKEILEQIEDLMPQKFNFILGSVPISIAQEQKLRLNLVAKTSNDAIDALSDDIKVFKLLFKKAEDNSCSDKKNEKTTSFEFAPPNYSTPSRIQTTVIL